MECRRFRRAYSVSERTTRPRLGEDCWSRGLQSALLLLVLRRGISHRWLLPWFMPTASMRRRGGAIRLHAHCFAARAGRDWGACGSRPAGSGYAAREHSTPLRDYAEAVQELGNSEVELAHDPAHHSHPAEAEAQIWQSVSGV